MINPYAINFWLCATAGGYVFYDIKGAAIGLFVSTTISLLAAIFNK